MDQGGGGGRGIRHCSWEFSTGAVHPNCLWSPESSPRSTESPSRDACDTLVKNTVSRAGSRVPEERFFGNTDVGINKEVSFPGFGNQLDATQKGERVS